VPTPSLAGFAPTDRKNVAHNKNPMRRDLTSIDFIITPLIKLPNLAITPQIKK